MRYKLVEWREKGSCLVHSMCSCPASHELAACTVSTHSIHHFSKLGAALLPCKEFTACRVSEQGACSFAWFGGAFSAKQVASSQLARQVCEAPTTLHDLTPYTPAIQAVILQLVEQVHKAPTAFHSLACMLYPKQLLGLHPQHDDATYMWHHHVRHPTSSQKSSRIGKKRGLGNPEWMSVLRLSSEGSFTRPGCYKYTVKIAWQFIHITSILK